MSAPQSLSPFAQQILTVAVAHSIETSPTGEPESGHNGFRPAFEHDAGPSLVCLLCGARLALEPAVATMLGVPITEAERQRISRDGP
jgi:hypothetical protein